MKHLRFLVAAACAIGIAMAPVMVGAEQSRPSNGGGPSGYSRPSTTVQHAPPPAAPRAATPAPGPAPQGYSRPQSAPATVPPAATAAHPPAAPAATPSAGGYSRPGASAPVAQPAAQSPAPRPAANNAVAAAQQRQISSTSLSAYQAERAQARTPPTPVSTQQVRSDPVYANARNSFGGSVDTYYSRRTTVYNNYRTSHPDVFIINNNIRPNYGIYDSGFLTGMMMGYVGASLVQNAAWMYAQQHQPWYGAYRADLMRQAETNAELRGRIAAMDAEIHRLQAQGALAQPATALPAGVDAAMAIAPEAVIADAPEHGHSWAWLWWTLGIIGAVSLIGFMALAHIGRKR